MRVVVAIVCLVLCATIMQVRAQPPANSRVELVFGIVPQFDVEQTLAMWEPILDYLAKRTGHRFRISLEETIPAFQNQLARGAYDLAFANPSHYLVAKKSAGYVPLVRSGARSLQGILVVRKDSDINGPRELRGGTVAFPANAFAATTLLQSELARIAGVETSPLYVDNHTTGYIHVVKGLSVAAGGVRRTFDLQRAEIRDLLKIIYKTTQTPSHPVIAHPRVPNRLSRQIRDALIEAREHLPRLLESTPLRKPVVATAADYLNLPR